MEREKVKKGRCTFLLNKDEGTARIVGGSSGRKQKYTLPESVTVDGREYTIDSVGIGAFCAKGKLRHLTVPDSYRYLDEDSFKWCRNLRSVHIGKGVEHYFKWSFGGCPLLERVTIDPSNPFIRMSDDGNLVLTKDGRRVLAAIPRRSLKTLFLQEGIERIEEGGISCCESLEEVTLPSSLKEIGPNAIFENPSLRALTVPEGVERLDVQSISFNENLERLDLSSSCRMMDSSALEGNPSLRTLILRSGTIVELDPGYSGPLDLCDMALCTLYVPEHLLGQYRSHPQWSLMRVETLTSIEL